MKNYFMLLLLLMLFFACGEKKNQIELLENYDNLYRPVSQLKEQPVLKSDLTEFSKEIKSIFEENIKNSKPEKFPIIVFYDYYVGLSGKIEKIKRVSSSDSGNKVTRKNQFSFNLPENFATDFEPKVIELLEEVEFNFVSDSSKSKFQGSFSFTILKETGNQIETLVDFGLQDEEIPSGYTGDKKEQLFFVAVDTPPIPIGGIQAIVKNIKYPEVAKRAGIKGRVLLKVFIDEEGNVIKAEIIKSAHEVLDSAAINAMKATKFKPGMQKGKSVKTQVAIPIVFELK